MNKNLSIIYIAIISAFLCLKLQAQSCLNCSSTTGINSGLIFCTTMTGNANDGTASPLTPTINGAALTTDRFSAANSAYQFTGSGQNITYASAGKLSVPVNQSFTMSIWFYQQDSSSVPSCISQLWGSDESSFALYLMGSSTPESQKLVFQDYYGPSSTLRTAIYSVNRIPNRTWNNATITINKTTSLYTLYLNGTVMATASLLNSTVISSPKLYIGNASNNIWGINGKTDDIRIYNRALDSSEVTQIYSSAMPALTPMTSQSICKGDSVQLAPGTIIPGAYSWTPATTISNPTLISPKAKPLITTKYYVTIESGGCSVKDSVTIQVDSIHLSASDTSACLGDTIGLLASGATSYSWTPVAGLSNPNIANPHVSPAKTSIYIVKGVLGACTSYDTVIATVCVCSQTNVYDTIAVMDSIKIIDSVRIDIFDTIAVMDTIRVRDTIRINVYDTIPVIVRDTITFHQTITDSIHVVIRDTIPIGVTDTLYIDIVKTGLNKPDNILNTIKIFPNPATDEIVIDNGSYLQIPNYSLKIVNNLGQTVFTNTINRQVFRLHTNTLGDAGTYFIQILDNNKNVVETRKIVLR